MTSDNGCGQVATHLGLSACMLPGLGVKTSVNCACNSRHAPGKDMSRIFTLSLVHTGPLGPTCGSSNAVTVPSGAALSCAKRIRKRGPLAGVLCGRVRRGGGGVCNGTFLD